MLDLVLYCTILSWFGIQPLNQWWARKPRHLLHAEQVFHAGGPGGQACVDVLSKPGQITYATLGKDYPVALSPPTSKGSLNFCWLTLLANRKHTELLKLSVWKCKGGNMDPKKRPELVPVLFWIPLRHFDLKCVRWMSGFLHIYRDLW